MSIVISLKYLCRLFGSNCSARSLQQRRDTLYQLRNLLNKTRVPVDPTNNMKGAEDFLLVVLCSHIVAATNVILCDKDHPTDVKSVSQSIIEWYVKITLPSTSSTSPAPAKAKD